MPGRAAGDGQADEASPALDRMVFGAKQRAYPPAANDAREARDPDFLPHVDDEEADLLVSRANADRRKGGVERRVPMPDRRKSPNGRRAAEYAPLRDGGSGARGSDESKRGPMLLVGALVIVAVFGFVVWNAYRDGLAGEETAEAPELSTAGAFKTPPRVVPEAPVVGEPIEVEPAAEVLDGAAIPAEPEDEIRPALTPAPAATKPVEAAPPPSKVMAPPPAPLKQPAPVAVAPAVQQAAARPVVATPPPAPAPVKTAAATPAPAAPAVSGDGYKPAFAAYGDHVVQIAATQSEGAALAEWNKLSKAYPELLSGGQKFIVQADSNGKTVYRVRVGSFGSKADASQFCAAFKAKGGQCYPAVK